MKKSVFLHPYSLQQDFQSDFTNGILHFRKTEALQSIQITDFWICIIFLKLTENMEAAVMSSLLMGMFIAIN